MAHAVEIEQRHLVILLLRLCRILLHLYLLYANCDVFSIRRTEAVVRHQGDASVSGKGLVVLCDLVPGRLVMVEVVLPVKAASELDRALQSNGRAQCWNQRSLLEHRKAPRYG